MATRGVEWVPVRGMRRVGHALGGPVMILFFAGIAWLDLQARRTGMIDMALMGGTLAGGAFLLFAAIIGKEQRKVRRLS